MPLIAADALTEAFRHSGWATRCLLSNCRGLTAEQLAASAPGSFGGILDTRNHIVISDARYLTSLGGESADWAAQRQPATAIDDFIGRVDETAERWLRFLAQPFDSQRLLRLDEGTYEARAGVVLAQALFHGHVHREQVCATLTGMGVEPPDLQPWAWGEATGRGRELT